jgi:hypothetical protein
MARGGMCDLSKWKWVEFSSIGNGVPFFRVSGATIHSTYNMLQFRATSVGFTNMSILNNPFDPSREAALVAIAQALVGEGVRTIFADVRGPATLLSAAPACLGSISWRHYGVAMDEATRQWRDLRTAVWSASAAAAPRCTARKENSLTSRRHAHSTGLEKVFVARLRAQV